MSFHTAITFACVCAGVFFTVMSACEVVKTFWGQDNCKCNACSEA